MVYFTSCYPESIKRKPLRGCCIFYSLDSIKREPLRGIEIALFFENKPPEGALFCLYLHCVIMCHCVSYRVIMIYIKSIFEDGDVLGVSLQRRLKGKFFKLRTEN